MIHNPVANFAQQSLCMYKNVIQGWWENLIKLPTLSATYIDFHGTV